MRSGAAAANTTVNAILSSGVNFVQTTSGFNLVQNSGQTLFLASGTGPIGVNMSGVSVSVNISGNVVQISGQAMTVSGNSIQPSYNNNTTIRGRNIQSVTANSGGTVLASGDCSQITLRALSGNTGVVFVGGVTGTEVPWGVSAISGKGFILGPGDGMTFPISNLNLVAVAAQQASTSGDKVAYLGIQY